MQLFLSWKQFEFTIVTSSYCAKKKSSYVYIHIGNCPANSLTCAGNKDSDEHSSVEHCIASSIPVYIWTVELLLWSVFVLVFNFAFFCWLSGGVGGSSDCYITCSLIEGIFEWVDDGRMRLLLTAQALNVVITVVLDKLLYPKQSYFLRWVITKSIWIYV